VVTVYCKWVGVVACVKTSSNFYLIVIIIIIIIIIINQSVKIYLDCLL
jgi:hypothetical protein